MTKRLIAAFVGALTFAILFPGVGLLMGWIEFGGVLPVAAAGAAVGAVLGWLRPGIFFETTLFFLDTSSYV